MCADQQVRELAAGRAGLREQLGNRELQQFVGEQESGLERHAARGRLGRRIDRILLERFVEEPLGLFLKDLGDDHEQPLGGRSLAVFDHRQVRDRRAGLGIGLHAAYRQVLEGQVVALAQALDLRAEEMRLAPEPGSRVHRLPLAADPAAGSVDVT